MLSDIWGELPYIIGCVWWWFVFPCLLIAGPWTLFYFLFNKNDWIVSTVLLCIASTIFTVLVVLGYIAACVAYESKNSYDGHHEWRDGAGPDTVCHYETRNELVGVIGKGGYYEDHVYTVCIDSRGR